MLWGPKTQQGACLMQNSGFRLTSYKLDYVWKQLKWCFLEPMMYPHHLRGTNPPYQLFGCTSAINGTWVQKKLMFVLSFNHLFLSFFCPNTLEKEHGTGKCPYSIGISSTNGVFWCFKDINPKESQQTCPRSWENFSIWSFWWPFFGSFWNFQDLVPRVPFVPWPDLAWRLDASRRGSGNVSSPFKHCRMLMILELFS